MVSISPLWCVRWPLICCNCSLFNAEVAWANPENSIRVNPDNSLVIKGPYRLPSISFLTPLVQLLLEVGLWSVTVFLKT